MTQESSNKTVQVEDFATNNAVEEVSIPAGNTVLRRLNLHQVVPNDEGGLRASSSGFNASSIERSNGKKQGVSVDWKNRMLANDVDCLNRHQGNYPEHYLGELETSNIISIASLTVGHDPEPDNEYHSQIWPDDGKGKLTDSQQKKLARTCKIIFVPQKDSE